MIGHKLILLDEVDSTNNYTAKLLNEGKLAHGTVILAEKQTAGRGQRGNSWSSTASNQLACSIYAETAFLSAERYWFLNLAVALAARAAIQSVIPEETQIKWPNDLLVNDRKLAGILIETQWRSGTIQGAIIGVGINIHHEPGLPSGGALSDWTETAPQPIHLAHELAGQLEQQFQLLQQGKWNDLLEAYHAHLWKKDERITAENQEGTAMTGYIRGIDGTGNLLFEANGERKSFGLKEITFRY